MSATRTNWARVCSLPAPSDLILRVRSSQHKSRLAVSTSICYLRSLFLFLPRARIISRCEISPLRFSVRALLFTPTVPLVAAVGSPFAVPTLVHWRCHVLCACVCVAVSVPLHLAPDLVSRIVGRVIGRRPQRRRLPHHHSSLSCSSLTLAHSHTQTAASRSVWRAQ